MIHNKG